MNGREIYAVLSNENIHNVIEEFTKHIDENPEALIVGTFFLCMELGYLEELMDAEQLKKHILNTAKVQHQYAGLDYNPEDFLDQDDEFFSAPDDGLAWVPFQDLWQAFEKTAEVLNN